jgi:hypothetical protein
MMDMWNDHPSFHAYMGARELILSEDTAIIEAACIECNVRVQASEISSDLL